MCNILYAWVGGCATANDAKVLPPYKHAKQIGTYVSELCKHCVATDNFEICVTISITKISMAHPLNLDLLASMQKEASILDYSHSK